MQAPKFYICEHCGNLVGMIHASGVPLICCGEPMKELTPNTVEASREKHLPVAEIGGNKVDVHIGAAAHPMEEAHHIQWVYLECEHSGHRALLQPGGLPEARLCARDDKPVAVYAYCNLHGLWKTVL